MNEQGFLASNAGEWERLREFCDRTDTSPSKLSNKDLREFVRLYRRASTDLAYARTVSTNDSLIGFLNDLCGRAYGILYREPRESVLQSILVAIRVAAQVMRRRKWFVFASALIFFGSIVLTFGLLKLSPDTRDYFVPAGFESSFDHWKTGNFTDISGGDGAMRTGFYASNNPKVAVITGAIGAGSFGLISVQLLFQNGSMLGLLIHELVPYHRVDYLLSSIFPHGVPELSGAIISGASGLLLGWALLFPGRNRRGDALREVGMDAVCLLGISVVMMFIAAPIEGYFSFNAIVPGFAKVIVGSVELVGWILFWSRFGLSPDEIAARTPKELAA